MLGVMHRLCLGHSDANAARALTFSTRLLRVEAYTDTVAEGV